MYQDVRPRQWYVLLVGFAIYASLNLTFVKYKVGLKNLCQVSTALCHIYRKLKSCFRIDQKKYVILPSLNLRKFVLDTSCLYWSKAGTCQNFVYGHFTLVVAIVLSVQEKVTRPHQYLETTVIRPTLRCSAEQ